jgi:peptidoglycan/LPS O-acetylase OafA/YrhL
MIQRGDHVNFGTGFLLLTAFFLVLVAVALGWFSWMRWRGMVVIGALTYPVYLLHYHLGKTAFREWHDVRPSWLLGVGVLAGILVLAYVVHRLVERPVSAALRRGLRAAFDDIRRHSAPEQRRG